MNSAQMLASMRTSGLQVGKSLGDRPGMNNQVAKPEVAQFEKRRRNFLFYFYFIFLRRLSILGISGFAHSPSLSGPLTFPTTDLKSALLPAVFCRGVPWL
jgi:hypothetical protein